jgi:2-phospho-L-lactate guanylyltransferase (CobY/MobA/RfbA family)
VSRRCVMLFARTPALEAQAKGMARARRLFDLGRRRVLEAAAALGGVDLVVVGGAPAAGAAHRLPQRGRGFGERLRHAFADVRALGYDRIVAVPVDCPRLGVPELAAAFAHLDEGRVVLGPSPDGGVYLLGVAGNAAGRLRGVDWCTSRVFRQLRDLAPGAACLPLLADVDTVADLPALLRDPALPREVAAEIARLLSHAAPHPDRPPSRASRGAVSPFASRPPPPGA